MLVIIIQSIHDARSEKHQVTTFCVNTVIPLFVKEKLWVELRFSSLKHDFLKKQHSLILLLKP